MLSILLPTYNANCMPLIETVYKQAVLLDVPFEILLADDASVDTIRLQNRKMTRWNECRYLQLEQNVGPARIRNYLATQAQYPYLLFLDSDVIPAKDSFLSDYLNIAKQNRAVCGGFVYKRDNIPDNSILRYKYGIAVEERTADFRNKQPYHCFISMNFLICREAFQKVRFDESFHLGYEDTLFGMQLQQAEIAIEHIDNPVYHCVEENSNQFLVKIKRAVGNLIGHEQNMRPYVKLLRWHNVVKRLGMQPVFAFVFSKYEQTIISNLTGKTPSLKLFAFYKLGYLCLLHQKQNRQECVF